MAQFEWVHAAWLALAIVLEIVANVFLKFSDGFRRKIFGLLSWRCWLPSVRFLKPFGDRLVCRLCIVGRVWYCCHVSRRLDLVWSTVKRKGWIGLGLAVGWNDHGETRWPDEDAARAVGQRLNIIFATVDPACRENR